MLSHCSFLGTALYGYVALALRAKQWEDGSIMPVTVRGARGGMTRALWLRMYACACMHVIEDVDMHACLHARMCVLRSEIRKKCRRGVLPRNRTVRSFHKT